VASSFITFAECCQHGYIKEYAMRAVAFKGEIRNAYTVSFSNLKGRYLLEDPGESGRQFIVGVCMEEKEFGYKFSSKY
jgi:hypothetical protein